VALAQEFFDARHRFATAASGPEPVNHLVVGSLCSSRVSMRSVQTECSTHHQRSRMSAACGAEVVPATAAARLVWSFVMGLTLPLSCVPWLHGHYPAWSLLRTL
jgi:hypothetical protein